MTPEFAKAVQTCLKGLCDTKGIERNLSATLGMLSYRLTNEL
jgi:hypothetical protein